MLKKQFYAALLCAIFVSGGIVAADQSDTNLIEFNEDDALDALVDNAEQAGALDGDVKVPFAQKLVRPLVGPFFYVVSAFQSCARSVKIRMTACYKALKKRCAGSCRHQHHTHR